MRHYVKAKRVAAAGANHNCHALHATAWWNLGMAVFRRAHRPSLQSIARSKAVMLGCHQAQRLAARHGRAAGNGVQAAQAGRWWRCASEPRHCVFGDSGTPLSPLAETTDSQQRKSGGAWYADPQRDSAIPWAACRARPRWWMPPRDSLEVLVQGGISALHAGWCYSASGEVQR